MSISWLWKINSTTSKTWKRKRSKWWRKKSGMKRMLTGINCKKSVFSRTSIKKSQRSIMIILKPPLSKWRILKPSSSLRAIPKMFLRLKRKSFLTKLEALKVTTKQWVDKLPKISIITNLRILRSKEECTLRKSPMTIKKWLRRLRMIKLNSNKKLREMMILTSWKIKKLIQLNFKMTINRSITTYW